MSETIHYIRDTQPSLTGLTRFRAQKRFLRRPVMVLQVEEKIIFGYNETQTGERLLWRDATAEDLTTRGQDEKKTG